MVEVLSIADHPTDELTARRIDPTAYGSTDYRFPIIGANNDGSSTPASAQR